MICQTDVRARHLAEVLERFANFRALVDYAGIMIRARGSSHDECICHPPCDARQRRAECMDRLWGSIHLAISKAKALRPENFEIGRLLAAAAFKHMEVEGPSPIGIELCIDVACGWTEGEGKNDVVVKACTWWTIAYYRNLALDEEMIRRLERHVCGSANDSSSGIDACFNVYGEVIKASRCLNGVGYDPETLLNCPTMTAAFVNRQNIGLQRLKGDARKQWLLEWGNGIFQREVWKESRTSVKTPLNLKLSIFCLYTIKEGAPSSPYSAEDVNDLFSDLCVATKCNDCLSTYDCRAEGHWQFRVLTNDEDGVFADGIELVRTSTTARRDRMTVGPGWWGKPSYFRRDVCSDKWNMAIDLDCKVIGNAFEVISVAEGENDLPCVESSCKRWLVPFYAINTGETSIPNEIGKNLNTTLMLWKGTKLMETVYRRFELSLWSLMPRFDIYVEYVLCMNLGYEPLGGDSLSKFCVDADAIDYLFKAEQANEFTVVNFSGSRKHLLRSCRTPGVFVNTQTRNARDNDSFQEQALISTNPQRGPQISFWKLLQEARMYHSYVNHTKRVN